MRFLYLALFGAIAALAAAPACAQNNFFGAHLVCDTPDAYGKAQLQWARQLNGKGSYLKTLFGGITRGTKGAPGNWKEFVSAIYQMDMIPVIRLAGVYDGAKGYWLKPESDADGSYKGMAEAVKSVVRDLPRSDKYPLYIEVWNEPNLDLEWSGKADLAQYAHFFTEVSRAIRSLGDKRIVVMNGAFALCSDCVDECVKADPDFINAFDVWASHPYPQNHPPSYNIHDKTARYKEATIDGYILETEALARHGRKDVKVMITETGWVLGNGLYETEGYPAIDEANRADYTMRAFRDYYPKWPEIVAVLPFLFSDAGWKAFNWVDPDSATLPDGVPVKRHAQYDAVRFLAKPTDSTGAISGTVMDAKYKARLPGAAVSLQGQGKTTTSDAMGNFWFPSLNQDAYLVVVEAPGFRRTERKARVLKGANTPADMPLAASATGTIAGRVTDGMTGAPLPAVAVALGPGGETTKTDTTGAFRFQGLPAIPYTLEATLGGYNSFELAGVSVSPNQVSTVAMKIGPDSWPKVTNMALNPGFEKVADPGAKQMQPLTWEALKQGSWEVTQDVSRTGKRSMKLNPTPEASAIRQITNYGTITPGKTYAGGIWIRTDKLTASDKGGAWMSITFTDNGGAPLKEFVNPVKVSGTSDWKYLDVQGAAPEGSQRLSLNLWIEGQSGAAYFDDAFLGMLK
ncbi:MAG: carboxypeptidase regulatory-like domain-containing protein [Armatimonadetes bacterium]|nr:carboxypeptidase regulatory-like domain-containing protein [Armatimonadota bacterium]